ncbi:phage GP46 family protein [Falsiroseomonas sp.]|uniref:phage GP46 family protein n=1 Tax=Falsiroseomonas sp. TaxID=2870721 RepID=UPI003F72048C
MADLALRFDPSRRAFDLVIEGRDLARDATLAPSMILAIGCDRRALPDDVLPAAPAEAGFGDRRGWCGDALDAAGRRLGSRLWLLRRAKQSEDTRGRAERYAQEALAPLVERGASVSVAAAWLRRDVLSLTCRAGSAELVLNVSVSG